MTPSEQPPHDNRVLAGLRVFEVSIAVAAPSCGRHLAYHGAEVFKIEARSAPDVARMFGSAWARDPELADVFCDTSPYVAEMSAGKRSVGLELKQPAAMEAARRLLATCDVFLTNYSAPAIGELGLGYEAVAAVKPDIVYAGMTGFGATPGTPYFDFRAFGPNQSPLVGLDELTGYPDQDPAGIASVAPPDYMGGLHATMAILTALRRRDADGEGSFLDISQMETTVALLGPWLIGGDLGAAHPERTGSRLPWAAPVGVYPCLGDDKWVAVFVGSDEQWDALAEAAGIAEEDRRTLAGRLEHHDEIDDALSEWTSRISADEAAARLQAVGVAAHPVHDHRGVLTDPHVRDRRYYEVRPCSRMGRDLMSGHPIRMSDTPASLARAGPNMGEDTVDLLGELGYDRDEIDALLESGAAFAHARPEVTLQRPFDAWYEVFGLDDAAPR
ncbi:MAG TPA: hypothetical protein DEP66_06620 [Acidimicrobiaceae bacterium]|nr:hypothetical protein [Acidimicrobiaceae bacterium]HCB37857.1 hypothetical protein [Acidimicrobiaceae bacterium]